MIVITLTGGIGNQMFQYACAKSLALDTGQKLYLDYSMTKSYHDQNIKKSIDINIIGTANIVKICQEHNIKLIYFSTNYVYPGFKHNHLEESSLLPFNNYGWSKPG